MKTRPFVTVVIPTFQRMAVLGDCLESLMNQIYPSDRYEVIVVDDGSLQPVGEVVRPFAERQAPPSVRYVRQENAGLNAARNRGIAEATGDPICFIDDDALAPRGWLIALVDAYERNPEAGCIGGPARARFEGRVPRMCAGETIIGGAFDGGPQEKRRLSVYGMNLSVRRWAIEKVGGFDESLPIYGEEEEWQARLRAGGSYSLYVPDAWLEHRRLQSDLTRTALIRAAVRRGRSFPQVCVYLERHISALGQFRRVPVELGHALSRRCFGGVLRSCYALASSVEALRRSIRGPRSDYIHILPSRAEWKRLRRSTHREQ